MRCAQTLAYVLLLVSTCQVLGTGSDKLDLSLGPPGSGSRTPSPEKSGHTSHAHAGTSVRLFGVDVKQASGKASTSEHNSHRETLDAARSSQSLQRTHAVHPIGTLHSHSKVNRPGNLRHLVAGLDPSPSALKRPVRSAQGIAKKTDGKRAGPWWKRPDGKPNMQNGLSPDYQRRKQWRDKQKEKKLLQAKEQLDQHPSGHHQHPPSGPGSPGAGSHAISRRDATSTLVSRASDSDSRPTSSFNPKGKSPGDVHKPVRLFGVDVHPSRPNGDKSVRLFGADLRPDKQSAHETISRSTRLFGVDLKKPASPAHLSQTGHDHQAHPVSSSMKRPGQLGHLVAGMKQQDSSLRPQPKRNKRPADTIETLEGNGRNRHVGPWWKRPNSRPNIQMGRSRYYETRRRYHEKQKQKKLESQGPHDQHPIQHYQQAGQGPGSPGAGSHAVSKRRLQEAAT